MENHNDSILSFVVIPPSKQNTAMALHLRRCEDAVILPFDADLPALSYADYLRMIANHFNDFADYCDDEHGGHCPPLPIHSFDNTTA